MSYKINYSLDGVPLESRNGTSGPGFTFLPWSGDGPAPIHVGTEGMDKRLQKQEPGLKFDAGKPRMDLLSPIALEQIAKVMGHGAEKYAAWNFTQGMSWSRLLGAALRHLFAWSRGKDTDTDSGLPHLAHCGACVLMLLHLVETKPEFDDRNKQ